MEENVLPVLACDKSIPFVDKELFNLALQVLLLSILMAYKLFWQSGPHLGFVSHRRPASTRSAAAKLLWVRIVVPVLPHLHVFREPQAQLRAVLGVRLRDHQEQQRAEVVELIGHKAALEVIKVNLNAHGFSPFEGTCRTWLPSANRRALESRPPRIAKSLPSHRMDISTERTATQWASSRS